jgi:hypothetical protein
MDSSSNSSFSSNKDEVLYDMDQEAKMLFHAGFITCTFGDLFIAIEMEEGGGHSTNPINGVQDVLTKLRSNPTLFKNLTNFILIEFEDLTSIVVPTIISHAWSIGEILIVFGRPSKLNPKQHLLNFVFSSNMTISLDIILSCKIGPKAWCVMKFSSSHLALILHLWMRSIGLQRRK